MWRDFYAYVAEFVGASAVPANGFQRLAVNIDREADFALYRLAVTATSLDAMVQITDQADRLLIDGFQPLVNLMGSGQWPYELDAARVIKRQNQIRLTVADFSGADNTVRVLLSGAQLYPGPPYEIPTWRWGEPWLAAVRMGPSVVDDRGPVPANGVAEFALRLPGDAWFEVHRMTGTVTGPVTVQVLTNAVREWFRLPVHATLLGFGSATGVYDGVAGRASAGWPYQITPPKLLPPNTVIVIRVADLSGAPNIVRLSLHGIRRYT